MAKQTQNIMIVSLFLLAIYLYSFTADNIETEILGFNSFKFLISLAVLIQFAIFLPSFLFQTEKFYDLTGSLTFISISSIAYFSLDNPTTIDTILYLYVIVWAGRLGIFLFRRINKDGKDERFDKAKKKFFWFLQYWMGQAAWVVFTAGASILAILSPALATSMTKIIISKSIQSITAGWLIRIVGLSLIEYFKNGQDWGDGGIQEVVDKIYRISKREDILNNFVREAISKIEMKKYFKSNKSLPPFTM